MCVHAYIHMYYNFLNTSSQKVSNQVNLQKTPLESSFWLYIYPPLEPWMTCIYPNYWFYTRSIGSFNHFLSNMPGSYIKPVFTIILCDRNYYPIYKWGTYSSEEWSENPEVTQNSIVFFDFLDNFVQINEYLQVLFNPRSMCWSPLSVLFTVWF